MAKGGLGNWSSESCPRRDDALADRRVDPMDGPVPNRQLGQEIGQRGRTRIRPLIRWRAPHNLQLGHTLEIRLFSHGCCPWRARRPFILSASLPRRRPTRANDFARPRKIYTGSQFHPRGTRVGFHGVVCDLLTFINLSTENSRKFGGRDAPSGNLAWPATGTSIRVSTWLIRQCDLATKARQRPTSPWYGLLVSLGLTPRAVHLRRGRGRLFYIGPLIPVDDHTSFAPQRCIAIKKRGDATMTAATRPRTNALPPLPSHGPSLDLTRLRRPRLGMQHGAPRPGERASVV